MSGAASEFQYFVNGFDAPDVSRQSRLSAREPALIKQSKGSVDIGPYAKFPNRFFGSGLGARLGVSAGYLYLALCDHANRKSEITFKVSDRALAGDTGIAPRTICNARKKLAEFGLITFTREKGQSHVYKLSKLPLQWTPLKQRMRGPLRPRGYHAL